MIQLTAPRKTVLEFPVELRPLSLLGEDTPLREVRAVYRPDTREVLDIVSNRYVLVRHDELFEALHSELEKTYALREVRTFVSRGGTSASVQWILEEPDLSVSGEPILPLVTARNSLDRSSALEIEVGGFRTEAPSCTLIGGDAWAFSWVHRKSEIDDDLIAEAGGWIHRSLDAFPMLGETWSAWAQKSAFVRRFVEEMGGVLGDRDQARLLSHFVGAPHLRLLDLFLGASVFAEHFLRRSRNLEERRDRIRRAALDFVQEALG